MGTIAQSSSCRHFLNRLALAGVAPHLSCSADTCSGEISQVSWLASTVVAA